MPKRGAAGENAPEFAAGQGKAEKERSCALGRRHKTAVWHAPGRGGAARKSQDALSRFARRERIYIMQESKDLRNILGQEV